MADGREADARPQHVLDAGALREERVDDGGAGGDQGRLAQVAQQGEDGVERLEIAAAAGDLQCHVTRKQVLLLFVHS